MTSCCEFSSQPRRLDFCSRAQTYMSALPSGRRASNNALTPATRRRLEERWCITAIEIAKSYAISTFTDCEIQIGGPKLVFQDNRIHWLRICDRGRFSLSFDFFKWECLTMRANTCRNQWWRYQDWPPYIFHSRSRRPDRRIRQAILSGTSQPTAKAIVNILYLANVHLVPCFWEVRGNNIIYAMDRVVLKSNGFRLIFPCAHSLPTFMS